MKIYLILTEQLHFGLSLELRRIRLELRRLWFTLKSGSYPHFSGYSSYYVKERHSSTESATTQVYGGEVGGR